MRSLYEINNDILSCVDEETGEIIDSAALDALNMELDAKIEGVACWIKDLKAEAEALKAEKQALADRQKKAENKAESLKKWLAFALNGKKFESARASVSFRKSKSVEITDINELIMKDDDLLVFQEPKPDKKAIAAAIKSGREVAGAVLVENESVIIK